MSLASRVSALEELSSGQGGRRLSFNPVPGARDSSRGSQKTILTIGAFEVAKARRILQVVTAVLSCLIAAGIIFGYAAIKSILIHENVYRNLCTQDELDRNVQPCFAQEVHLNLMFTVAAVGTNVAALPVGAILDKFGPQVCGIFGSIFLATGALLFAFAAQMPFDTYIPGYLFLAIGGSFVCLSAFQLSNAFPKHSGLILALLTGAFDASSAVFLLYNLMYQWTSGDFLPKDFFLLYLVVPAFILVVQLFLMPSKSYKTVGELVQYAEEDDTPDDQVDESTVLLRDERRQRRQSVAAEVESLLGSKSGTEQIEGAEMKHQISGVWGVLHGKSAKQQILSPWFFFVTLFSVIQITRINYFVATIRPQYEYLLHSHDKAVAINDYFNIALPLGGILSVPFIGLILDNTSTGFVLSSLVTIATAVGVLGILPYTWAAYANVTLFALYRPFFYTSISDYSAKVFGFRTFGTVYGLVICLAGLGNFSQSGLDTVIYKVFDGNPVPVNLGLLIAALLVGVSFASFVVWRSYSIRREGLIEEAEDAEETIMPGAEYTERL